MLNPERLCQSPELNWYHSDIDPGLSAAFRPFVVADEPPMTHQPAKGPLHNPAPRQDGEAIGLGAAFDNFNGQLWFDGSNPLGKLRATVAAINPELSQPSKPTQQSFQKSLGSLAFRDAGGGHQNAQHQTQGVDQQKALATLDFLARVITNVASVAVGFDTLTVQNGGL